jgi:hypothetical protein
LHELVKVKRSYLRSPAQVTAGLAGRVVKAEKCHPINVLGENGNPRQLTPAAKRQMRRQR